MLPGLHVDVDRIQYHFVSVTDQQVSYESRIQCKYLILKNPSRLKLVLQYLTDGRQITHQKLLSVLQHLTETVNMIVHLKL